MIVSRPKQVLHQEHVLACDGCRTEWPASTELDGDMRSIHHVVPKGWTRLGEGPSCPMADDYVAPPIVCGNCLERLLSLLQETPSQPKAPGVCGYEVKNKETCMVRRCPLPRGHASEHFVCPGCGHPDSFSRHTCGRP